MFTRNVYHTREFIAELAGYFARHPSVNRQLHLMRAINLVTGALIEHQPEAGWETSPERDALYTLFGAFDMLKDMPTIK